MSYSVWVPYAVIGIVTMVLAVVALRRSGRRPRLAELLAVRGGLLVLLAVMLGMLADAAAEGDGLTAVDRPVWSWLVGHRSPALTAVATVASGVGGTAVMGALAVLAAAILAFRLHRRDDAILVLAVTAGAGMLVILAKPIIGRVRPPEPYRLVTETNQSFPSGHAVASAAVLGVLAVVLYRHRDSPGWRVAVVAAALLGAAAIGVSRLYLGVHWPTDIVGGWLSGGGWLLCCLTVRTLLRRPAPASALRGS